LNVEDGINAMIFGNSMNRMDSIRHMRKQSFYAIKKDIPDQGSMSNRSGTDEANNT